MRGLVLVALVAEFGTGVLLTCTPKLHQLSTPYLHDNSTETDGSTSVPEFPTKRLHSLRNMDQDQH